MKKITWRKSKPPRKTMAQNIAARIEANQQKLVGHPVPN